MPSTEGLSNSRRHSCAIGKTYAGATVSNMLPGRTMHNSLVLTCTLPDLRQFFPADSKSDLQVGFADPPGAAPVLELRGGSHCTGRLHRAGGHFLTSENENSP